MPRPRLAAAARCAPGAGKPASRPECPSLPPKKPPTPPEPIIAIFMGRMVTCLVPRKGGIMIRLGLRAAAAATMAVCALAPITVVAQTWPTKPVKFLVPFPPGGSVAPPPRILGARLADSLGQQFIIENKTGAGGSIGTAFVAKSTPH